jgi:hypothetical protein
MCVITTPATAIARRPRKSSGRFGERRLGGTHRR